MIEKQYNWLNEKKTEKHQYQDQRRRHLQELKNETNYQIGDYLGIVKDCIDL